MGKKWMVAAAAAAVVVNIVAAGGVVRYPCNGDMPCDFSIQCPDPANQRCLPTGVCDNYGFCVNPCKLDHCDTDHDCDGLGKCWPFKPGQCDGDYGYCA